MNFVEYVTSVEREYTRVCFETKVRKTRFTMPQIKLKLLERLWQEGAPNFPRGWVPNKELNKLIDQSDFRRRITELADEQGCDIGRKREGNLHFSRLNSLELDPVPRANFSDKQRVQVFNRDDFRCQICGRVCDPKGAGRTGPQVDHKQPIKRRGTHEWENWQTLCAECNVAKRRACEDCLEDCQKCPWAVPERFGMVVTVGLPRDLYQAALDRTERGSDPEVGVLLTDALQEKLRSE